MASKPAPGSSYQSIEYQTMVKCASSNLNCIKSSPNTIGTAMFGEGYISEYVRDIVGSTSVSGVDKAQQLLNTITDRVKTDPLAYNGFVEIIRNEGTWACCYLEQLQKVYEELSLEAQQIEEQCLSDSDNSFHSLPDELSSLNIGADVTSQGFICPYCKKCSPESSFENDCPHAEETEKLECKAFFPFLDCSKIDPEDKKDLEWHLLQDYRKILKSYARLENSLINSLESREVNIEKLDNFVWNLVEPPQTQQQKKVEKAETVTAIFIRVRPHKSFFNYDIVEEVSKEFGTPADKKLVAEYVAALNEYCKRSVFEVPPVFIHNASERNDCKQFAFKYTPGNPVTLGDVQIIRRKIASILGINVRLLKLCSIEKGCVKMVFLVPEFVLEIINSISVKQRSALTNLCIKIVPVIDSRQPHSDAITVSDKEVESPKADKKGLASFTGLLFEKVRSRIEAIAGDAEQLKVLLRSDYSESAYGQDGINIDMIKPDLSLRVGCAMQPTIPEPEGYIDSEQPKPKPVLPNETGESMVEFIYRRTKDNYVRLTSDIRRLNPHHVAVYLFQNNLIGMEELNYSANLYREDSVKATRLANVIFTCDLPHQFQAVLTAFEEAGVETVTEIAAEARDLYPDAFLPSSDPETPLSQQNKNLEFDQLKEKITQVSADGGGGPTAAIAYINELVHPKERELLLHKASHGTTDLNTFNIVLLSTEAALINFSDERVNQRTPLHVACACLPDTRDDIKTKQQLSKIDSLLKHEAKATLQDIDGNTPLHLAALRGNAKAVSLILTLDPDSRNIANHLGNTALHIASKKNFLEVARALCAHKVDACLSNKTKKSRTPLHQAASNGHLKMANMILEYEPSSAVCVDKKNMSPLLLAAKCRKVNIVERLVKKSLCPVFVIDNEGRTPLHFACAWGSYELVELLLKANSSRNFVNHKDNKGDTALHIAGHHGDTKVWKLLCSKNASKKAVNDFDETPKEVAANAGHHSLPYRGRIIKKVTRKIQKKISKQPTLSSSQSCVSLRSTASALSFQSTISANNYLQTTEESDLDETV